MIPTLPQHPAFRIAYGGYVLLFFIYLALPLVVVSVFAFNDAVVPALPWQGFTWDWFFSPEGPQKGLFYEPRIMRSIGVSLFVAVAVASLSVVVGTCNAFLFERHNFPFKNLLYVLMLLPLVIPGIILGISILMFSSVVANGLKGATGISVNALRPGLLLVILGQFSFIATMVTLVVSARLKKFDTSLEEAALNLGATPFGAIWHITIPYLRPALFGGAVIAVLMSFENFNTTLMLVGSDSPLTITMFDRLKEGSTPVLNAVSLLLMVVSSVLALSTIFLQRRQA